MTGAWIAQHPSPMMGRTMTKCPQLSRQRGVAGGLGAGNGVGMVNSPWPFVPQKISSGNVFTLLP